MFEQTISVTQLNQIINNFDRYYANESNQPAYLLFIKKQLSKPHCSMFVCDFKESFWSMNIDVAYFKAIKNKLQLKSPLKIFISHFINSLKRSSYLEKIKTSLKIHINLEIGEGLTMSCFTMVQNRVHYNNPDQFKKIFKIYLVNYHQVKEAQLERLKNSMEIEKMERENKIKEEKQAEKMNPLFTANKSTTSAINYRKRDLMNPQKKKRRSNGAKIGNPSELDASTTDRAFTEETFEI